MAIFKCKMCGGDLEVIEGASVCECEYCGTKQTVSATSDDVITNLYNRANNLRRKCEFDKAEQIYEKIVQKNDSEAEAHWGIVLCKYGIEYVEDPETFKRVPTCHRTSYEAIRSDADYQAAIDYADASQQALYEEEARYIDKIQKDILAIANNEKPFDVFICYKETDENGKRTVDSVVANDIYYQLTQEGFKVFYAAITLEDKLGQEYEPYIFSALNSANVMLVVGTKPEYFNAVWVKNEWSRYLKIIKNNRNKLLIPCYRDMDAYDLPEEFSHLQAQDMSKIGFINDVVRGIKKVLVSDEPKQAVSEAVVVQGNSDTAPLLERIFMFLEDGEWESADEYAERVLDLNPKCAEAYLAKLLSELKVKTKEDLKDCKEPFENNNSYQKVLRFGSDLLCSELKDYNETIKNAYKEQKYSSALQILETSQNIEMLQKALQMFKNISDYKDSSKKIIICSEKIKEISELLENEKCYSEAVKAFETAKSANEFLYASKLFEKISSYKDSYELMRKCSEKADWLNTNWGILKIVFKRNIKDADFSVMVDDKVYHIGKIKNGFEWECKLSIGSHVFMLDNNMAYATKFSLDRKEIKTFEVSKAGFGDHKIKAI